MPFLEEQITHLEAAIAGLETQRSQLGDQVVELALAPLHRKLLDLRSEASAGQASIAAPAPSASNMAGERKIATIMFADIAGFTAMSEQMDPEAVRDLINQCFEQLVPVIERYEGTVDKFIGDEIMAIFGAPLAHENDPERSLRAAVDMMAALLQFNAEQGTDLGLHIGINTGWVVAGGIGSSGRQQYSVMGDAVNLAARLVDASERGEILIGSDTRRFTETLFDFETLPAIRVKGKSFPVPVHRLLAIKAIPGPQRNLSGLRSPMVGREAEFQRVTTALQALLEGRGNRIAIIGEAGLGKSRLIMEARRVYGGNITWVEGRSLSHMEGVSYWVARDMLYSLVGVKPDASPVQVGLELRSRIERLFPNQVAQVYPYLARLCELPLDEVMEERVKYLAPQALQERIFQAVRDCVEARAKDRPLALVWEDLQWADPSSLRLLQTLFSCTDETPLLLLLVFRQEESRIQTFHRQILEIYGDRYQVIQLTLLSDEVGTQLLRNLLKNDDLPEITRKLILDKAEGNAFFLEEVVRSLIDSGLAVLEDDRAIATQAIEELQVPDTVQGVVASRIDRLPPEHKQRLQTASVIGRVFQQRVLAYLFDQEEMGTQIVASLSELSRRELILPHRRAAGEELAGREFIFKHAITHDVAYNSLLIARRKELHRAAGDAIEALLPDRRDDLAATLAHHFEKAENPGKAIRYLTSAGDRAAATFANEEAISFYRRAIAQVDVVAQMSEAPSERWQEMAAQLQERMGDVLGLAGRHDETRAAYRRALDLASEPDRVRQSHLHRKLGNTWQVQRRYEEAFEEWLIAESVLGPPPTESAPTWWQGWVQLQLDRLWGHYWRWDVQAMTSLAEQTRPVVERHGTSAQRSLLLQCLTALGLRRERYVVLDDTLAHARASVEASRESGDLGVISQAQFGLGFCHLWRGELDEATTHMQSAIQLAERIGDIVSQTRGLTYFTIISRRRGQIEETRENIARTLGVATSSHMIEYMGTAKANLAWLAWREANYADVQANGRAALGSWQQLPSPYPFQWTALWPLIGVALAQELVSDALAYSRVLLLPTQLRQADALATVIKQAGQAWDAGETEAARTYLDRAVELAQDMAYL